SLCSSPSTVGDIPMPTITFNSWTSAFTGSFNSTLSFQAFEAVVAESPLLVSLLNSFGGTIDLSGPGKPLATGTGFESNSNTIYIDPAILPTGAKPYAASQLATTLAHELGHALVNGGHLSSISAATVAEAIHNGLTGEGTAAATEFVVA